MEGTEGCGSLVSGSRRQDSTEVGWTRDQGRLYYNYCDWTHPKELVRVESEVWHGVGWGFENACDQGHGCFGKEGGRVM